MTDAQEKRLIEALRKVDAHGDVAPAHVQDPMNMVLRQRAIQADPMRWGFPTLWNIDQAVSS